MSIGTIGNKAGAGAEGYFKVMKILHTEQMDINTKRPHSEHSYTYILPIFMGARLYIIIHEAFWQQPSKRYQPPVASSREKSQLSEQLLLKDCC